ncbi:MAG: PEFG-CTERM sorting domain-containing protein [Thaumarchaeota archaeon]|nr:MAG: PEFG-CTERM sorting domain-containing protein [Nitrososphaerota archaeon]
MQNQKILFSGVFLLAIIVLTPLGFSASLGDDWSSIKSSLSSGEKADTLVVSLSHVNDAHLIYTNNFKLAAYEVDSESDILIEAAFDDIIKNHTSEDSGMVSLNRQVIDKTIYKIAYMKMELAVEKNSADDFITWYSVLDKKFKVSEKDYESNNWIAEIESTQSTLSSNGPAILEELLEIFKLKTIEELEEAIAALEEGDVKSAKKFTYEGLYYYRTLHPAVEEKLGTETANELLHEMEEAIEVTMSGNISSEMKFKIEHIASEVELIIREYEGGDTSEIGLALSGIKDRLNLVEGEYFDAVSDGQIIDQGEYDETVIFLSKAKSIFDSVKPSLMELSESDTVSLETHFIEMDLIVSSIDKPNKISILVGKSLNNIASFENFIGGATEIDIFQYFDEIDRLLNDAKTSYRNGDSQLAFDLVSEAYLDNYEFVEGPLGEVDPELMTKIETDMREDLRNMIKNGESFDSVDAQIDMILMDLDTAQKIVPEFGTIAMMVLAVAIISIVAITSKSKFSIIQRF